MLFITMTPSLSYIMTSFIKLMWAEQRIETVWTGVFNVKLTKTVATRRVLSETKAIMSPPVCHWMESYFCRGRWNRKQELSQLVMNTPCATWKRGLIVYLDLEPNLVKHKHITLTLIIANISGKLFVNPTRGSKDKERTQNTVIQCLILNFDLDLQLTLKHKHCTSSHYSWHSCSYL